MNSYEQIINTIVYYYCGYCKKEEVSKVLI